MEPKIIKEKNIITILTPISKVKIVFVSKKSILYLKFDSPQTINRIKKTFGSLNPDDIIYKKR